MSRRSFRSSQEELVVAEGAPQTPQTRSPAYSLAFADGGFLLREDLRPVRLQLELLKAELLQQEAGITQTVVFFGGARILDREAAQAKVVAAEAALAVAPEDPIAQLGVRRARSLQAKTAVYDEARKLARLITERAQADDGCELVVLTGGGPGIMEAANRGADDAQGRSIGMSIVLPFEAAPNSYISPELCFNFHYFALRKMHMLIRARAIVAFPGGFGTLDEVFETLTLIQTQKMKPMPVLLFDRAFWERVLDFDALLDEGTIGPDDLELISFVDTAEEAWAVIAASVGLTP